MQAVALAAAAGVYLTIMVAVERAWRTRRTGDG
jgi:hypothetical protein